MAGVGPAQSRDKIPDQRVALRGQLIELASERADLHALIHVAHASDPVRLEPSAIHDEAAAYIAASRLKRKSPILPATSQHPHHGLDESTALADLFGEDVRHFAVGDDARIREEEGRDSKGVGLELSDSRRLEPSASEESHGSDVSDMEVAKPTIPLPMITTSWLGRLMASPPTHGGRQFRIASRQARSSGVVTSGTSSPSAVARSIWCSCSLTRICRIFSASAYSPSVSHWRTRVR